jgi:hypothetical protein
LWDICAREVGVRRVAVCIKGNVACVDVNETFCFNTSAEFWDGNYDLEEGFKVSKVRRILRV